MNVFIDKPFDKDVSKIKDKSLMTKIAGVIEQVRSANQKTEINNLKKIKGFETYYRIRLGDYRIGIEIIEDINNPIDTDVYFIRFLHTKDIYKYYP